MRMITRGGLLVAATLVAFLSSQWATLAQAPASSPADKKSLEPAKPGTRFSFEVIESYNAKYLGDQPGHRGRSGGLVGVRPSVALGDPVYHGEKKVGAVTSIAWSRTEESLTVEFDPEPLVRVAVGDSVWLELNTSEARR